MFCLTYLQGGRLVTQRRMTSDLYMFNLETFEWEYIPTYPEDDIPQPRYFHSTDSCKRGRISVPTDY